ncbi:MAG: DUF5060 domain-containing protein [Candidatus Glassbacteria bacterium]
MKNIRTGFVFIIVSFLLFSCAKKEPPAPALEVLRLPLYGLFESALNNMALLDNAFQDVELRGEFTAPSGKLIHVSGFYDGGRTWKIRFMPTETGTWFYNASFSDGTRGETGSFECVEQGAFPGPWKQDPDNPRWLISSTGKHFLPVAVYANCHINELDWKDLIAWCKAKGYNTIVTPTFNATVWGNGWGNRTAFAARPLDRLETVKTDENKMVVYDRYNLDAWKQWDKMILDAAGAGIYIAPSEGPGGRYGGQAKGNYPPDELAFYPELRDRFDSQANKNFIRYLIARQAAFWNIAYWSLGSPEVSDFAVTDEQEFLEYGRYLAQVSPDSRMIAARDGDLRNGRERRWLSRLDIPAVRKLNTVQTAPGDFNDSRWQAARPNNDLALNAWGNPPEYGGFPVLATAGLWEGQARADKPLRIIWSFIAAGAHTIWADWRPAADGRSSGSRGRCWTPLVGIDVHLFTLDRLGAGCVGDEQLALAAGHLREYEYWKMKPHNELAAGGAEAYCLAEPERQYLVYAPAGGSLRLDLGPGAAKYTARWFDPREGAYTPAGEITGGAVHDFAAPDGRDWVLSLRPARN